MHMQDMKKGLVCLGIQISFSTFGISLSLIFDHKKTNRICVIDIYIFQIGRLHNLTYGLGFLFIFKRKSGISSIYLGEKEKKCRSLFIHNSKYDLDHS